MRVRPVESLVAIAAIVAAYLVAEAAFSLLGLRYVPLGLHGDLPPDVRVFAQSSKHGVVPRDPVLLLGESYAQGFGDWLLESDPNRNGPFHSAHVIQRLSGRDVVALGASGAGSAEGVAALPAIAYAEGKRAWRLRLPPPRVAVIYFYEGNDLNDNLRFLARRAEGGDGADAERIDRALAAYPAAVSVRADWRRHFPLLRFSARIVRRLFAGDTPADDVLGAAPTGPANVVEVAGRPANLPASLQSPAMELTRTERERAGLVFERSLVFLGRLLPGTPILVVYLPSPLSSYRLLSPEVSIQQYVADRAGIYPKERVAVDSDEVCRLTRAAAVAQGAGFLDLRPAIRAAGARDLVHGPRDFKHFNRTGMEVLGRAVAGRIDAPSAQDGC